MVWNCGGYESLEALRLLEGVVDVYLPDAKYGDDETAFALSGCRDYTFALDEGLREMHRQVGDLELDGELAVRGLLVRHLVLPYEAAAPARLMPLLAAISPALWMNVMSQYRPVYQASLFPILARAAQPAEVQSALLLARRAGLRNLLMDGRPLELSIAQPDLIATVRN